jgi:light-harvesting complex 1 beta chain
MDANSLTGLNEDEAKSFGNMFVVSFLGFLAIAIVAHYLVWQWRPWIPGAQGYPTNIPTNVSSGSTRSPSFSPKGAPTCTAFG